jgi:hypothetical protein
VVKIYKNNVWQVVAKVSQFEAIVYVYLQAHTKHNKLKKNDFNRVVGNKM